MDANRNDIISSSLDGNSSGGTKLRTSIHEEYLGVISHAIDRIEILRDDVNVLSIVQSMAAFLVEVAAAPSSGFITPGLTHALKILKLCLSRSSEQFCLGNEDAQSNFDTLISVLKASIATIERMDSASSNQVRDNNHSVYAVAGWLVLDSISFLMGICPLGLDLPSSDVKGDSQIDEQEYAQRYTTIVATIAPLVGTATYNLFLDLILYQPNGSSCGLSTRGMSRMQAPAFARIPAHYERIDSTPIPLSRWNELKLVVLKVATGTVKGGGVFGWRGEMEEEEMKVLVNRDCAGTARAIALLVLAASGRGLSKEKHAIKIANFANASLQAYVTGEGKKVMSAPKKKKAKGRRSLSPSMEDDSAIVCAASMLLCLALGEVEACSAIRKHEEQWSNTSIGTSSTVMMIMSTTADDSRSPLSANKAHAVLSFVVEQFQISKAFIEPIPSHSLCEDKAALISVAFHATQLSLLLNEANDAIRRNKRMQIGWGDVTVCASQLLLVLGEWLNACIAKESLTSSDLEFETKSAFVENTCKQLFDNAYEILKYDIFPLLSRDIAQGLGIGEEDQPDDALPVAYRHRGRLARERRVARSRQDTLVPPLGIRKCCVDIIRKLARYSTERENFLDVPVLLLKCLAIDEELSPHIANVLEELLEVYEPFVTKYRAEMEGNYLVEDRLVQSATPLLPSLLTASTSASSLSRRVAVKWCAGVVIVLDKLAARVLCTRLATDSDKIISTQAKKIVGSIKDGEAAKEDVSSSVMFFDSGNELDMEIVQTKLDNEIEALAANLQISRDGAAVIMQSNHFSFDRALEAIQKSKDLESTLKSCGVRHRCRSLLRGYGSSDDNTCSALKNHQCKICYDDMVSPEDVYSLPCKHVFCRDCFSSYLRVKIEGRELLNCPHHGCNEYVVESDVKELLPSMLRVWKELYFRQFITKCGHYKFCRGSDCTMVAFSETKTGDAQCTKCDASFCFCCGEKPHTPATCRDAEKFMPLFNTSDYCVMKFSKRCPSCAVPIQKNQGCNHMTCRECNSHFCWLCLSLISGYDDLERHACNKFDPRDSFNAKERDEFFLTRYEASAEGEVYAKKGLDSFLMHMSDADSGADDDIRAMAKAFKCLITCRNFLKNTFIIGWSWQKDETSDEISSTRKEIFEAHQATLTAFTENLQQLVEKKDGFIDLDTLHFYSCALKLYVERMMDFISRCRDDEPRV